MKYAITISLFVTLTACATSSTGPAVSQAQIAACWQQAGLQGDLYKFYNPAQHGVLTSASGASQAQLDSFNACIGQ